MKGRGLKVMLTLFHHSLPPWALAYGGWADGRTVEYFVDFARWAGGMGWGWGWGWGEKRKGDEKELEEMEGRWLGWQSVGK